MVAERIPVQVACRVLVVSESGYYERLKRAPSERAVRHAWLTDLITEIHVGSRGIYGGRRVHAELTLGRGVVVGHGQVELLMQRPGLRGVSGRPMLMRNMPESIATDKVNRAFARNGPNQLWVTDITEHPTREGKV
jgi:transposase InsO family protein